MGRLYALLFLLLVLIVGAPEAGAMEIDVLKATTAMLDYLTEEECTMDPDLRSSLGLAVGDQFLLQVKTNSAAYGLVTINRDYQDGTDNDDIRMRLSGRQRFNQSDSFDAYASAWTPVHGQSESWLNDNDEFGEFLSETDPTQTDLLILAPHGGVIESYSDDIAVALFDELDQTYSKDASVWYCIGHQDEIGAFDAWHITSTAISENSFPYLSDVSGRTYEYAVSIHGYSGSEVFVGGGAATSLKEDVKDALDAISWGYMVTVVGSGHEYGGTSSSNIVNRYSSNGVQIELPYSARTGYWADVAQALAGFYKTLI